MKSILLIFFILVSACSSTNASEKNKHEEENEYSTLLSSLLNINEDKYTYIDAKGKKQPDSLKMFKELERIYIKNITPDFSNNKFSTKRLKIIMFYSFYAHEKKSGAFQEYLASDLMPIYNENRDGFLQILKQLPFLTLSNCNRLNAYFGFEGKNIENKTTFIKQNKTYFKNNLNAKQFETCISSFNEKPNK
ncbi:MAG: hypothetical protein L3J89_13235 [Gammaproteobacteria bacterium]|nr:hypothetical protein [Gammaproteobacteria bacterium]